MHKEVMEQKIDDASSRDALHVMFHQLKKAMQVSDNQRRRSGPFEGTFEELSPLSDRVIRRLAVFDLYDTALNEAKKASVVL